jgi:hypothetical protein
MPVFDFHNDWRNWQFHPVKKSPKVGGDSEGPVFSGYLWIWLALALGLTILTALCCWWYFRDNDEKDSGPLAPAMQLLTVGARLLGYLFHRRSKTDSSSDKGSGSVSDGLVQPESGSDQRRTSGIVAETGDGIEMTVLVPQKDGPSSSLTPRNVNPGDIV